jgi:hypothetical protein
LPVSNKYSASYDLYLPKAAFIPLESVGCWAELMEQSLLNWEKPDGEWQERQDVRTLLRNARFRCELVEEEMATALDRLRELLAFMPPDWQEVTYDRRLALALAEKDMAEYKAYMAKVDGRVDGEWPKLRISPSCVNLIAQMGTVRRDKLDEVPAFVEALLLGVSVRDRVEKRELTARPFLVASGNQLRNQVLLSRKFSLR